MAEPKSRAMHARSTAGQQAMALAMIYPEPIAEERGRGKKGSETKPFSKARLSQARSVLRHSRELAEGVIKGSLSLHAALAKVRRKEVLAHRGPKPPGKDEGCGKTVEMPRPEVYLRQRVALTHLHNGAIVPMQYPVAFEVGEVTTGSNSHISGLLPIAPGTLRAPVRAAEMTVDEFRALL